jgi:hypothetical protein
MPQRKRTKFAILLPAPRILVMKIKHKKYKLQNLVILSLVIMSIISLASWGIYNKRPRADRGIKTAREAPILGKTWGLYQKGYGEVKPETIFNGGDPTGLIEHIQWQSWGGPEAIGYGTSSYVPYGKSVAGNSTKERATVVAYKLETCDGKPSYLAVQWYFPQHGEKYDPSRHVYDICPATKDW